MSQKLMIIDTDCGIDDAQAIMLALASSSVKILGITCCFGNSDVDNVCQNVLRVLSVCQHTQVGLVHTTATTSDICINIQRFFRVGDVRVIVNEQLHIQWLYWTAQVLYLLQWIS